MMKVETREFEDQVILEVEGRLAGAFVPELEKSWQLARANQPTRKVAVDLRGVTCVDRAGRYLILLMHSQGAGFFRAGLAIQDILEELLEQPKCK
jgi:anti-anti-sigma regulatory factor